VAMREKLFINEVCRARDASWEYSRK
jgi:hypothetical protein